MLLTDIEKELKGLQRNGVDVSNEIATLKNSMA